MRILIDTNIFIYREDDRIVPENLQKLLRALNDHRAIILYHPKSVEELEKDTEEERKRIILSKINVYTPIENPPDPIKDKEFLEIAGHPTRPNDYSDNAVIYAIYKDAVDFLITEDKGLHKKANRLAIKDRVLSIDEALGIFEISLSAERVTHPPALKEDSVFNLDINDPFFGSLKEEYEEFERWFKEKSRGGRRCFVFKEDDKIGALLIYKIENEPIDAEPSIPARNRLKISTFKADYRGHRIGELFIKLVVEYSIKKNLAEIYLTHFTKPVDYMVDLITEYGFRKVAKNRRGEDVYIKELFPDKKSLKSLVPLEVSKGYWPCYHDGKGVKKFIIPIQPEYHNRLFIESGGRQTKLYEHGGTFIIEGNTIKKAYLCHSKIRKINPGDVLLFYRSQDRREITSIGVAEKIYANQRDADRIMRTVVKRTVYKLEEIKEMAKKPTLVILFTWHFHLPNPLKLDDLKRLGVLTAAPQSIVQISPVDYEKIKGEGDVDGRFTID